MQKFVNPQFRLRGVNRHEAGQKTAVIPISSSFFYSDLRSGCSIVIERPLYLGLMLYLDLSPFHFVCGMSERSRWQSVLRFLLTAGAVYVLTLTSLSSAQATCGDYLSHAGSSTEMLSDLTAHPVPMPVQQPCSGPECQNHLPDPAPESPVIMMPVFKPACAFSKLQLVSGAPLEHQLPGQDLLYSGTCRLRIDRPPRTAAV